MKIRNDTHPHRSQHHQVFTVLPFEDMRGGITVKREMDGVLGGNTGKWEPATLNWSALGSVPANTAAIYIDSLQAALGIALLLDLGKFDELAAKHPYEA